MGHLRPLGPAGDATPEEVIAALGLRERAGDGDRPRVAAVMIASVDGRATVAGRSGGLGHPVDRALLRGLRASADGVLVGPATVRAERYADLVDPEAVSAREAAGLPGRPPVAIVTRSGDVPWEVGLFAEEAATVVVAADTPVAPPGAVRAQLEMVAGAGLPGVLAHLASAHGAQLVLCEGGPRLLTALAAEGLLDDLVLTVAPMLAAGDGPGLLAGPALDPPVVLELTGAWRADDHLFLHYRA